VKKRWKLAAVGGVLLFVVAVVAIVGDGTRQAGVSPSLPVEAPTTRARTLPDLTPQQERDAISAVRTRWRAESGESVDEIISKVGKVAHFIVRGGWGASRDSDEEVSVGFGFVRSKATPDDEALSIYWLIAPDGTAKVGGRGFHSIELGSKALALDLIQSEVDDEVKGADSKYLYDPRNLSYLQTDAGPLSDVFARHRCTPKTALHAAEFAPRGAPGNATGHDQWTFDTTIDCRVPGARYCTDGGVLVFKRQDHGTWQPATACASVLVGKEPADFMKPFLQEQAR
jgi:hypothetical protein